MDGRAARRALAFGACRFAPPLRRMITRGHPRPLRWGSTHDVEGSCSAVRAGRLIRFVLPVTAEASLLGHGETVNVRGNPYSSAVRSYVLRLRMRSPASIS